MNPSELSQKVKSLLKEQGFTHAGITEACRTNHVESSLNQWLDKKLNGSMHWMEKRKRERGDIFEYYPEAKSVISTGINYFTGRTDSKVKISNYAWGDDYHDILKKKLHQVLKNIKEINPAINGRVCVDTSPVMEKMWAQKAGIGWIGKHTNLITRDFGSWIFLGEIILDIDLEYDPEFYEDLCGTCTACMDACPVDALTEPYQIDASKCISYLTIEYRDEFDPSINNHDWIYGCDICQEVCPWNVKFEEKSNMEQFHQRKEISYHDLDSWTKITKEEFNQIFRNSAVKRTKFSGFKRNVQNVLNSKQEIIKEKANP